MTDDAGPDADANTNSRTDDAITVDLPLRLEFASTLRVIVASLGADAEFSIDEIDDLRLAVSEVFTLLAESGCARCSATFNIGPGVVSVTLNASPSTGGRLELDPLAETILSSVVNGHEITDQGITLVKRAAESMSN